MAEADEKSAALLEAMKKLNIESVADFKIYMGLREKEVLDTSSKEVKETTKYPRISLLFGEKGKGEVSYRTWRYEVNCVLHEKAYSKESLMLGIRRSLRGEAADMVMRLGESASIEDIMEMFHSTFGNIETSESILKKFHACEQDVEESVVKYATRVEELFSQAVEMGALYRTQQILLKSVFYEGLHTDLKIATAFKFETISDYNKFKAEVRKLETEIQKSKLKQESRAKASCNVATKKDGDSDSSKSSSELRGVKSLLEKLNERIDKLEQDKAQSTFTGQQVHTSGFSLPRSIRRGRGPRNFSGQGRGDQFSRYRGSGRGNSPYVPRRPLGTYTFKPADIRCYQCNELGHIARNCPLNQ